MSMTDKSKVERRQERLARRARDVETFFSSANVLGSENIREYNALYKTLKSEMPRSTLMEKMRVKQLADSIWLVQRALRLQVGAIEGARVEALLKLLMTKFGSFQYADKRDRIAMDYFAGDEDDKRRAMRTVEKLGITRDMIEAYALEIQSSTVVALDKMRARCEHSIDQAEKKLLSPARSKKSKKTREIIDDDAQVNGKRPAIETALSRRKDSLN